ncbi:MAG: IS110 family transposase [Candidatus Omnitrophota bacterium]
MNILKQTVGIDVSMDSFEARFGTIDTNQEQSISKSQTFNNDIKGFRRFLKWALSLRADKSLPLSFVMEVTGVYHENLAYFLHEKAYAVVIVLSNKIRNYAKSLETKSKTDSIDALTITRFALERKLTPWSPPEPFIRAIKGLAREYLSLKTMMTEIKNQIHAKQSANYSDKDIIKRKRRLLNELQKQIDEILQQIKKHFQSKPGLYDKITKVATIKGIGEITIIIILAETNCFEHVTNINQLISYAGLDVVLNESGKKKGKTTISKRGNKFIRRAMFMPAMSACRSNTEMKETFARLVSRGINKKAAVIAVARKLLVLIYTLWKNDSVFIRNYKRTKPLNLKPVVCSLQIA